MKKIVKIAILVIIICAASYALYFYNTLNAPNSGTNETKNFKLENGWGSQRISQELSKAGLIKDPIVFELYVWAKGISSKLLPGNYDLAEDLNVKEMAKTLSRGVGSDRELSLTFIEGWNIKDIAQYLQDKGYAAKDDFIALVSKKADWWDNYDFLADKPHNVDLEGYLFPDTYRIFRDAPPKDLVVKMLDNFNEKLTPDLREEIKRQGKTIPEIITMASIVEKEVSTDEDRAIVAGIFYQRIKAGIALQSDATVNYATGLGETRPSAVSLKIDSLYNTYKYKGLPPGPICNPSLSSIMAAIYPTASPFMYFLTTPDGKVIYSRSFAEHSEAKAKYFK